MAERTRLDAERRKAGKILRAILEGAPGVPNVDVALQTASELLEAVGLDAEACLIEKIAQRYGRAAVCEGKPSIVCDIAEDGRLCIQINIKELREKDARTADVMAPPPPSEPGPQPHFKGFNEVG